MNLRQKGVKGVVWSAIANWGSQAISFVVFLLLARLLEPEVFGLIALASLSINFLQIFLDGGFSQALIQRHELEPEHLDTAFWTNLGISVPLMVISVTAAGPVADLFKQPQLTPVIRWLSLSFLFGAFKGVQQAILQRSFDFKSLAVRSLIAMSVGGLAGVITAFLGFGVWSLVVQQLVGVLTGVLVLWQASPWRPGLKVSMKHFKELFAFGINVVGLSVLTFFSRRSDDLLIGYFLGPVALGYYTIAYRLLLTMQQTVGGIIQSVGLPMFSRLQREPERLRHVFYNVTQLGAFLIWPLFLGVFALAPELVRSLFGDQWIPSIRVMQILSLSGINTVNISGLVISAMGKPNWNLRLSFLNTVANIIGFAIAVRWGILAVALAFTIRSYLLSPIYLWITRKLLRIEMSTYLRQYAAPLVGSLTMVVAIFGAKYILGDLMNLSALLAIYVLIGTLVYTISIQLTAPTLLQQVLSFARLAMPFSIREKS